MKKMILLSAVIFFLDLPAHALMPEQPGEMQQMLQAGDNLDSAEMKAKLSMLSMPFIKYQSQDGEQAIKYYAPTCAGTVFIKDNELAYALTGPSSGSSKSSTYLLTEKLSGAKKTCAEAAGPADTRVSFFIGADESRWRKDVPAYREVRFGEAYTNIRVACRAYGNNVEKLFFVEPGGRPEEIALEVSGADRLEVNGRGELEIATPACLLRMTKPVAFQEIDGKRIDIAASYAIPHSVLSTQHSALIYGFNVGDYNKSYPLVIDPVLASTFLGGGRADYAFAIALDASGNVFVAGHTFSGDFPKVSGGYTNSPAPITDSNCDVFIAKFDKDLTQLLATALLGGSKTDSAHALAINAAGDVFVGGETQSADFPINRIKPIHSKFDSASGAFTPHLSNIFMGRSDAFVSKLNSSLSSLEASTFLGGIYDDAVFSLATVSEKLPAGEVGKPEAMRAILLSTVYAAGYRGTTGAPNAFVARLSGAFTAASCYSATISDADAARAVVQAASGEVYVAGYLTPPQSSGMTATQAFVARFDRLLSSQFVFKELGGSGNDYASALAVAPCGDVYVAGSTMSASSLATPNAFDTGFNGSYDGFVMRFDPKLADKKACTYIGGQGWDEPSTLAIDKAGNVIVAGHTASHDFPVAKGSNGMPFKGATDGFIVRLNCALERLTASTFLGGRGEDTIRDLVLDSSGNVFCTGGTDTDDFPTTAGAYDTTYNKGRDAFVAKLAFAPYVPSVIVSSFEAIPFDRCVQLKWTTTKEIDVTGFNIKRAENETGPYINANINTIPSEASPTANNQYSFVNCKLQNGKTYFYELEVLFSCKDSNVYGPVSATPHKIVRRFDRRIIDFIKFNVLRLPR